MCKLTKHLFHIENWYYSKCKDFVILKDQYQRTCLICGNSLANYIYLPLENQLLKLVKKFPNVSLMGCLINHTSIFLILFQVFIYPIFEKRDENYLKDSCDGELYRNFIAEEAKLNHNNQSFTFSIFTDGISMCKKSKISVWPFLLVCNELPSEERFCFDNILVGGKKTFLVLIIIGITLMFFQVYRLVKKKQYLKFF